MKRWLHLKFDNGSSVGSWPRIPDPDKEPDKFLRFAEDIGFHIAYGFVRGAHSVSVEWKGPLGEEL